MINLTYDTQDLDFRPGQTRVLQNLETATSLVLV